MNITIRTATDKDFPTILDLVKELAVIEKALYEVKNTVELMKEEQEYFKGIVAETKTGEIVGMAVYYFVYYTWVGKSLYLDDLCVKQSARGQKIGSKLVQKVFDIAREEKCKRLRWQVIDFNDPAIEFYNKIRAKLDEHWINCDFDEEGIKNFKID